MVGPIADFVVSIGVDGRIKSQGTLKEALAHDAKLRAEVAKDEEQVEKAEEIIDLPVDEKGTPSKDGKLIVAQEVEVGSVRFSTNRLHVHLNCW